MLSKVLSISLLCAGNITSLQLVAMPFCFLCLMWSNYYRDAKKLIKMNHLLRTENDNNFLFMILGSFGVRS